MTTHPVSALIDSGAEIDFMDVELARNWNIPVSRHNPHIDWRTHAAFEWSDFSSANCFVSAFSPLSSAPLLQENPVNLTGVPAVFHDMGPVFSKSPELSLPPHRPNDCDIELFLWRFST